MNTPKKAKSPAAEKDKKTKLVRDSFTMPKSEYAAIETLKERALQMAIAIKKSELLRAGLMALSAMDDASYKAALAGVPTLKTGRPSTKQNDDVKEAPAADKATKTQAKEASASPRKTATRRVTRAATPSTTATASQTTTRTVSPRPRAVKAVNVK